jgi:hypothetical protein
MKQNYSALQSIRCKPLPIEGERNYYRIWGSYSGGYEEYYLLGYNAA